MKKYLIALITLILFAASVALLVFPKGQIYQKRVPTARFDPDSREELYEKDARFGIYDNEYVKIPNSIELAYNRRPTVFDNVLSAEDSQKRIEVDLTNQRLYAYEGNQKVYDFLISSGLYNSTPTGTFKIWIKIKSQKMSGGSVEQGTYYYLPNVPYILFFYNDQVAKYIGYGIHGAYWHNNFGHPMSHGCINVHPDDVEKLYYWAQPDLGEKTKYQCI